VASSSSALASAPAPAEAPAALELIDAHAVEPVHYDWGGIKWLCNDALAAGCNQSFGLAYVLPGRTNPEHWHSTCEEIIHVLAGTLDVKVDGVWHHAKPGMTVFLPAGCRHVVSNNGWEPCTYVASFSAAQRGTRFSDPDAPGAAPGTRY